MVSPIPTLVNTTDFLMVKFCMLENNIISVLGSIPNFDSKTQVLNLVVSTAKMVDKIPSLIGSVPGNSQLGWRNMNFGQIQSNFAMETSPFLKNPRYPTCFLNTS